MCAVSHASTKEFCSIEICQNVTFSSGKIIDVPLSPLTYISSICMSVSLHLPGYHGSLWLKYRCVVE